MNINKHRLREIFVVLAIIIIITIVIIFNKNPGCFSFLDSAKISNFINSTGVFAPILLILLLTSQCLFPLISASIAIVLSGAIFGFYLGTLYSLIGFIIGASINFWLSRKFGRGLEHKLATAKEISHFDRLFKKDGASIVFLGILLSPFPMAVLFFFAGLSKIKYGKFLMAALLGAIPYIALLNFFGCQLRTALTNPLTIALIVLFVILFIIVIKHTHEMQEYLHHQVYLIKKKFSG